MFDSFALGAMSAYNYEHEKGLKRPESNLTRREYLTRIWFDSSDWFDSCRV